MQFRSSVLPRWAAGHLLVFLVGLGYASSASRLQAQSPTDRVQLHGFGSWKYGRTSRNEFLSATSRGDYQSLYFDLNVAAHPIPHLTITAQVGFDESHEGRSTDLAYAFAEWKFSDKLKLRAGKVQHPFGIYTEVFDVGTLRPFLTLPQAVYGPVGIISEAFEGVGLRGRVNAGSSWSLAYDLYAGGITVAEDDRPLQALAGSSLEEGEIESNRDVLGGRLVVETPVPGLSFGGSVYSGSRDSAETSSRETIFGSQVEYSSNIVWMRAELVQNSEKDGASLTAGYVEASVFLATRFQVTAQYSKAKTSISGVDVSVAPWLVLHEEGAFGVAFWPSTELVVKASFHLIHGNRFAFPHEPTAADLLDPTLGRRHTRLFQTGVQFSF